MTADKPVGGFIPNVWATSLLEHLRSSPVFTGEPFISPQRKPEPYKLVEEGSYLPSVLREELYLHVPDDEVDEAAGVMIAALNAWIEKKVAA